MAPRKRASESYVALLRGVTPTNAKMSELTRAFEEAGFTGVKTVLASGNVVFDTPDPAADLPARAERAMSLALGRSFRVMVRSLASLRALLAADPFPAHGVGPDARRVVTFLREPPRPAPALPVSRSGARVLALRGSEAFTTYDPGEGPVFMKLIEDTFGDDVTTRTWGTLQKIVATRDGSGSVSPARARASRGR